MMPNRKITIAIILSGIIFYVSSCFRNNKNENAESLPETVSYNFNIRPILSDKCFKCHGPDANHREAHLRLDIADSAYAELKEMKGAFAIVPGKPDRSELLRRVTSSDAGYQMPPPDAHLGALTDHEKKLFEKWIKQGAKYERHWAFATPVKTKLPSIGSPSWPKNEIDYFVLHKLEEQGLAPNEASDKERLLKRVCLDLTGLPPALDQMDQFLAD